MLCALMEARIRNVGSFTRFLEIEEYTVKKLILISNDSRPRLVENILILPWKVFLERLWNRKII